MLRREAIVEGRRASYLVGGKGPVVVFLHGWGLAGTPTYVDGLNMLCEQGFRVFAPALPGFGSADLSAEDLSLAGYARWVVDFVAAVGVTGPVSLVGYSFGGGVAIRTAHDWPERVGRLVLVNSIGGSVWRAAHLARTADLTSELEELKRRRLPAVIVWSRDDGVIPAATIASLRAAAGDPHFVPVDGSHCWLTNDPFRFCEVITNVLHVDLTKVYAQESVSIVVAA